MSWSERSDCTLFWRNSDWNSGGLRYAPAPKRDWAASVAAGKFEQVVAEADRWGLDACLAGASSSELASLADAARLLGKPERTVRRWAAKGRLPAPGLLAEVWSSGYNEGGGATR